MAMSRLVPLLEFNHTGKNLRRSGGHLHRLYRQRNREAADATKHRRSPAANDKASPAIRGAQATAGEGPLGNLVIGFIQEYMNPVRHTEAAEWFDSKREELNKILAFAGYELTDRGTVQTCTPAQTLTDAQRRANRLRADLEKRGVHADVLRACRAELLQENYFHVVLEATKSIAQKLRDRTGLASDGAELADAALALGKHGMPFLAFNTLRTNSEISEQNGLLNLVKGLFGTFRNPTAHAPKISWNMTEPDALDLLTMASFYPPPPRHRGTNPAYCFAVTSPAMTTAYSITV
jgi:uncharacterized protein (TIGR02391 family)